MELIKLLQNFVLSGNRLLDMWTSLGLAMFRYSKAGVCTGFHLTGVSSVISGVGFL